VILRLNHATSQGGKEVAGHRCNWDYNLLVAVVVVTAGIAVILLVVMIVVTGLVITPAAFVAPIATIPAALVVITVIALIIITPTLGRMPDGAAISPARSLMMSPPGVRPALAGNVDNLAGINPVRVEAIILGNTIGVFVKLPTNAIEGIAIADNIMSATAATTPSRRCCFTFSGNSQLQQNNG
jgi:hypothetical protein